MTAADARERLEARIWESLTRCGIHIRPGELARALVDRLLDDAEEYASDVIAAAGGAGPARLAIASAEAFPARTGRAT